MKLFQLCFSLSLLLLLSGCNLANIIKMRYANDDLTPVWPNQTNETVMPAFYNEADKPYIEVSINGIPGFRFMIDTGASMSYLIDTEKAKALNLKKGYSLSMGGWGDQEDSTLYQTRVDSLTIANVAFTDVNMAFLQASNTHYFARPDEATFDGILGHDILRHFRWTFDKETNKISISSEAYKANGDEVAIPFEVTLSKLAIPVEVDFGNGQTVSQDFLIDTGSRHYAKVSAAYVNNNVKLIGPAVTGADFGLSGKTEHFRTTIPGLKVSGQSFSNVKVNMIGPDDDEEDNWILGSALLNQQVTVIDYHTNTMYLLAKQDGQFHSKYNLAGLELRKLQDGRFVIRYVMPDMTTANADFAEGDVIYKINGRAASEISLVEWLDMSAKPGNFEICRTRKSDKCISVNAKHVKGYSAL